MVKAVSAENEENKKIESSNHSIIYADKEYVQEIYQLMKDVDDIFNFFGTDYWVDGGTLLGCVRHQGFIKWDDDLDVCVEKKNKNDLKKILLALESLDYDVRMISTTIFNVGHRKYKERRKVNPWSCPCIDIQMMEENKGKIFELNFRLKHPQVYFLREDLFPLQELPFGPLNLPCPHSPNRYLEALYGSDWLTKAHVWNHHITEKVVIELGSEEKKGAMPYKPLNDNFILPKK